jgi:hypothetical protein
MLFFLVTAFLDLCGCVDFGRRSAAQRQPNASAAALSQFSSGECEVRQRWWI